MPKEDSLQSFGQVERPFRDGEIDIRKIFIRLVSKWHYLLISLILALLGAFLYNKYSVPTFRVSTTLLINEGKKRSVLETSQFVDGLGLNSSTQNLENQIMVLSSKNLIGKTLDELSFYTEYYTELFNKKVSLYPLYPIRIVPEYVDSLPKDIEFTIKLLEDQMFSLDGESNDYFELHTISSFDDLIQTPKGSFSINLIDSLWFKENKKTDIKFTFHSRKKLIDSFRNRMGVQKLSKTGTIVELFIEGPNQAMDIAFLNKLNEIFLVNGLDKKNQEAIRTIEFIDEQLIGISDSLILTENRLQQFRSQNRVMDISAQGQVIIDQAMSLENQKARLGIEANYYDYLADYLAKDNIGQAPIAPATMGITDPGLTKLVTDLADIQGQYYSKSLGEKNPLQTQLAQRLRNTKEALRETLNGVRRSNNLAMNEINEQIKTVNAQASALPVTERQLLGIERKYKLNDELYTFLLEKRAGAQIQKASNMPDSEVIDPSEADASPIKPKKLLIYVLAILGGLGIPISFILIADTFSIKIKDDEDLKKTTDVPVIVQIPHSSLRKNTLVLDEPDSYIADRYRFLRSRIQYVIKGMKSPVIFITSPMREDGKTFSSVNLASVYSLSGKKTVIIDFDLRKPNEYDNFGLDNSKGLSTWLLGNSDLQDVIRETPYKNLYVLPAGPIPHNPYELSSLDKIEVLLEFLKNKYEYIIIDSSPLGTISDLSHLASLADMCLLIVRQKKTSKIIFESTINDLKLNDVKGLSIVLNDVGS